MPLEGGARLQIELKARAKRWASKSVEAGFFDPENATKAFLNEYGAPNARIPPRPFFRITIKDQKDAWVKILVAHLREGATSKEALAQVGHAMATDIAQYVSFDWMYIRNRPRTISRKGFDKPLWETGEMFKATRFKVVVTR